MLQTAPSRSQRVIRHKGHHCRITWHISRAGVQTPSTTYLTSFPTCTRVGQLPMNIDNWNACRRTPENIARLWGCSSNAMSYASLTSGRQALLTRTFTQISFNYHPRTNGLSKWVAFRCSLQKDSASNT